MVYQIIALPSFLINLFDTRDKKGPIYLYYGLWLKGEYFNKPCKSSVVFGWSWFDISVLGSQVFGRASMESCKISDLELQLVYVMTF